MPPTSPPPPDERFRPRQRIRLEKEFRRVMKQGARAGDDRLLVYVFRNDLGWSRLGISISKKVGNAVTRHYVRRRIREAFRRNQSRIPASLDIVCVARPPAAQRAAPVCDSLMALIQKAASKA